MKKEINKSFRVAMIWIMVVLACLFAFLFYKAVWTSNYEEQKVSLFSYANKADVEYKVTLAPNVLHNEDSLGEGKVYIAEFVDNIKAFFNYKFTGEKEADISGDYEVVGVVEGYKGEKESYKTIWKKDFTYIPKTEFNSKGNEFSLAKNTTVNLNEYNEFVKQVIEQSKVNSQVKLSVIMNVDLKADTSEGMVEKKFSPSIEIPLNENYFEIAKNQASEEPETGTIEETRKIQQPVDKKKAITYGAFFVFSLIGLVLFIFFTEGMKKAPLLKQLDQVLKKHGNRLVALNSEVQVDDESCWKVRTIEDLVRIADEIEKPILYQYRHDSKEIYKFYVFDEKCTYLFDLKEYLNEVGS